MPPGAPEQWFCCARARFPWSRCDLCGAATLWCDSGACDACQAPGPVGVDSPVLPRARQCARSRERAASPDFVEVCADDADGGGTAPAASKELQEATPYIYQLLQKSDWWREYKCLLSHEKVMRRQYYCMQLSKFPVKLSDCIPFSNSTMGWEGSCT